MINHSPVFLLPFLLAVMISRQTVFAGTLPDIVEGYGFLVPQAGTLQEEFWNLYEENKDLVGWLQAGDYINYPVVQYDNDFYLHHDFYGNDDIDGTLFVNKYNLLRPRDWIVMIHGHHMRSGTMFGRLMSYEDYNYLCQYPIVHFQTIFDDEDVCYAPIAAFHASMDENDPDFFFVMEPWVFFEEELASMMEELGIGDNKKETEAGNKAERTPEQEAETENKPGRTPQQEAEAEEAINHPEYPERFSDDSIDLELPAGESPIILLEELPDEIDVEELNRRIARRKEQYLHSLLDLSIWVSPLDASIEDEYLILSTCSYYQTDGRFQLVCRRLREDETPEMIMNLFDPIIFE